MGREGLGCGIEFQGVYDHLHTNRFLNDQDLSFVYLADNKLTLQEFLEDIEAQTNLGRLTFQIYKYN